MIDMTNSDLTAAGTLEERLNKNEPYVLLCTGAWLKTLGTDLAPGEVIEEGPKKGKGGYIAVSLRFTVMSSALLGEDVQEFVLLQGFGKNEQYTTQWFIKGQKFLSEVLGRPIKLIPTEEDEVADSDLPKLAGNGVLALLEIDQYQGEDQLSIKTLLDHVDEVPELDLGYADTNTVDDMNLV